MSRPKLLWPLPPHEWKSGKQDIHVWAADLDRLLERISSLKETLSPDEQHRAARFHFERDRNRFIAGRSILREILSSYLEIHPPQVHLQYGPRGKPISTDLSGRHLLHFNLGHSEDLILIAVTRACAVGIDVERVRPIPEFENIIIQYFSAREAGEFMALPKDQQLHAFYQLWTRKEACLKATGEGLSDSAEAVDVSFLAREPAQVRATPGNSPTPPGWTLVGLTPASEYVAALATQAAGLTLSCWQWPS
jgi:4'-phosphopantetheinyl transferase